MDKAETFKSVMLAIATVYDKQITEEIAKMYWASLSFAKPEHLQKAMEAHLADQNEGKWMPKPAHLIAYIRMYEQQEKSAIELERQIKERKEPRKRTPEEIAKGEKYIKQIRDML